ncbi:MAG: hypothetical protein J5J00_16010 [Deltaproteobacteria bacterium]|nr:hypothetical protein [Deltaproteobacteria bacterium]
MLTKFEADADRVSSAAQRFYVLFAACVLALFAKAVSRLAADPDLFARIAMGRLVIRDGRVPLQDPFAFTPTKPVWIDHEWLSGVVFYLLAAFDGDRALFAFKAVIMSATVFFLLKAQRLRNGPPSFGVAIFTLVLTLDCFYLWAGTVRSHIFTYFFLSLYYYLFERYRRRRNSIDLAWQAVIMPFWANSHGGFTLGLILQAFYCASISLDLKKISCLWLPIVTTIATLLNPYGLAYWEYIVEALSMERPSITEWAPILPFSIGGALPYIFAAIFLTGWLVARQRDFVTFAAVLFFAYCGVRHERLIALFSFSLVVLGAPYLHSGIALWARPLGGLASKIRRVLVVVLSFIFVWAATLSATFIASFPSFSLSLDLYPVEAVEWLERHAQEGDVLIDFNAGSYALWRLYPEFKVSIDGRYEEVYSQSLVDTVAAALSCSDAAEQERALSEINPDFIIARAALPCLESSEWKELFTNGDWFVYGPHREHVELRRSGETRPLWIPKF